MTQFLAKAAKAELGVALASAISHVDNAQNQSAADHVRGLRSEDKETILDTTTRALTRTKMIHILVLNQVRRKVTAAHLVVPDKYEAGRSNWLCHSGAYQGSIEVA